MDIPEFIIELIVFAALLAIFSYCFILLSVLGGGKKN